MSNTNIDAESSSGGGSPAAQAFKEQLAREEAAAGVTADERLSPTVTAPGTFQPPPGNRDARAAERKKVNGRARLILGSALVCNARMVDISSTGACVTVEDLIPGKKVYNLEFDIFHTGRRYVFGVQGVPVYSVLVSGKGYKVGFQFGPRTPEAAKALGDLIEEKH
jgi:hypothetical protein